MIGAWRYTTVACRRIWRWYDRVGPAEHVRSAIPACAKVAGIAFPLLALPGAVPVPTRPVLPPAVPSASYGGFAPGAFGPGAFGPLTDTGLSGVSEGLGGFGGGLVFLSGAGGIVSTPAIVNIAPNALNASPAMLAVLTQPVGVPAVITGPGQGVPMAFVPDVPVPQPVPCPPGVWMMLTALLGLAAARRRAAAVRVQPCSSVST